MPTEQKVRVCGSLHEDETFRFQRFLRDECSYPPSVADSSDEIDDGNDECGNVAAWPTCLDPFLYDDGGDGVGPSAAPFLLGVGIDLYFASKSFHEGFEALPMVATQVLHLFISNQ